MSIRVCNVTSLHDAEDGRIFRRICKSLSKEYEVYLVAPNTESRIIAGVHIVGVSLPDINHRMKRWMNLSKLLPVLLEIDAEVYHFHDPELMSLGLKLKRKGKKIIFDSHEDTLKQIIFKSFIPRPIRRIVAWIYGVYERRCLKRYDAVVSVTGFIVDRLKRINPRTYQITNYPEYHKCFDVDRPWDRSVCFAGLLSPNWMLNQIIRALPSSNAKMYMAGFYATEDYLNELKETPGWDNVIFKGTLSHSDVLELYGKSSVGMAVGCYTDPNGGFKVGSLGNTKIPDYMSSGLPVIVSDTEVWGSAVKKYKCGIVVDNPNDVEEIASAISYILDHPEEAKQMSENSLFASKKEFNWNTQEKILFKMYNEVLTR